MRNYAEEIAYWYLRLNGFFPLTDFVIHATEEGAYTSDCDLLAIRMPYVREDIGGLDRDWDQTLLGFFDCNRPVGVICEVKAGAIRGELFRDEYVEYCLKRFGFTPDADQTLLMDAAARLRQGTNIEVGDCEVFKLLISNKRPRQGDIAHYMPLQGAREFLLRRMRLYEEKRRDWVFFNSPIIQEIIWEVQMELGDFPAPDDRG